HAERALGPGRVGVRLDHLAAHDLPQNAELFLARSGRGCDRTRYAEIEPGVLADLVERVRGMDALQAQAGSARIEAQRGLRRDHLAWAAQADDTGRRAARGRHEVDPFHQRPARVLGAEDDRAAGRVVDHAAAIAAGKAHAGTVRIAAELVQAVVAVAVDLHSAHEEKAQLAALREAGALARSLERP